MKKAIVAIALMGAVGFLSTQVSAHPGGTNAAGCHTNRKTGDYHCHGGRSTPRPAKPTKAPKTTKPWTPPATSKAGRPKPAPPFEDDDSGCNAVACGRECGDDRDCGRRCLERLCGRTFPKPEKVKAAQAPGCDLLRCADRCAGDEECGRRCIEETCHPKPEPVSECSPPCGDGERCSDHVCRKVCKAHSDCAGARLCIAGTCRFRHEGGP